MATHVKLLDNGTIKVGDREIPKKRRRDDEDQADKDYRDLYKYLGAAINRVNSMQNKLLKIGQLSACVGEPERVPCATSSQQEATTPQSGTLALVGGVEVERTQQTAQDTPQSTSGSESTLALFDPDRVAGIGDEDEDDDVTPLRLDPESYLAKAGIRFTSWAHRTRLTESNSMAQPKDGIEFPHKKRKETGGDDGKEMCWVETNRRLSVNAKLTLNGKETDVNPTHILSQANGLLKPGERLERELRFRAFVVDGNCTNPFLKSSHTRPTAIGDKPTIKSGCMWIDPNDGSKFTSLQMGPFHKLNPGENKNASANGSVVTFDDFKFRPEALSGRINNSSNGSLRIVIVPHHPVLKRLESFYTISDEFKIGARVRPISKPTSSAASNSEAGNAADGEEDD
jgi:hypothetical protein